jgi:hypothetical protein
MTYWASLNAMTIRVFDHVSSSAAVNEVVHLPLKADMRDVWFLVQYGNCGIRLAVAATEMVLA